MEIKSALLLNAIRKKYRWSTARGLVSVEDLFDLPLSKGQVTLNGIAVDLHNQLKNTAEVSFVEPTKADVEMQEKFELVKYVIEIRLEENKVKAEAAHVREHNAKIDALILEKKEEDLRGKTIEELEALRK